MTELNMHKAPKGIFEKTMLQNMFQFCEPDECFQSFRLVCKSWKNAVETIRFNQYSSMQEVRMTLTFLELDQAITNQTIISTNYFDKYLPAFKQFSAPVNICFWENKNEIFALILKNMKKLNELDFASWHGNLSPEDETFMYKMIENSRNTLSKLHLSKITIPDVTFPKMTQLSLCIGRDYILLEDFETHFPRVLENMEILEKVTLNRWRGGSESVLQYIDHNYQKHCIHGRLFKFDLLNYIPLKIATTIFELEKVDNKIYGSHLQYAQFIFRHDDPMEDGWDRYQEIFDQCTNLKAIELVYGRRTLCETLPNLSEPVQEIWQERLSYFEARGIRVVDKLNKIGGNANLQKKLAKEAGITWRFDFH